MDAPKAVEGIAVAEDDAAVAGEAGKTGNVNAFVTIGNCHLFFALACRSLRPQLTFLTRRNDFENAAARTSNSRSDHVFEGCNNSCCNKDNSDTNDLGDTLASIAMSTRS